MAAGEETAEVPIVFGQQQPRALGDAFCKKKKKGVQPELTHANVKT
jgi:hypothetical protein